MAQKNESVTKIRDHNLNAVFAPNITAKILQVAQRSSKQKAPLTTYPHTVPQTGPGAGRYEHREADFWTCGFFPGSIYALLERVVRFPGSINSRHALPTLGDELLKLGRHWSVAINQMSGRTDTHDMGFIVQPALQKDYELTGNKESLESVKNAAYALATRYDPTVKAIRSWDVAINDRYSITDMSENFLVIIDSMCNLDLLYFVGHTFHDESLITIATQHAKSIINEILRPNFSSYHLVNFDPTTGKPKAKMTNQGHADESTWSRGQAWSVMGFAQTYTWTKDLVYLETAIGCAKYFLGRLEESKSRWHHPYVPAWDFDAPGEDEKEPLRDVSAGVIVANGLLIIHQALQSLPSSTAGELSLGIDFLDAALIIVSEALDLALDRDFSELGVVNQGDPKWHVTKESGFDTILRHATANNNEHAHKPYSDHGLVYADYYLIEFGNKLLRMGLI
ncbi:glycoside hydrolase family 88 protein [Periconia macrospinosa]|uniref:Glycoside hydrolase family 88 protein n=1 Tax=Periconia macrospinosa TaxID=97972 RepID=A0A2V1DKD9_9PLEO|nr:glycoside hydrolase family 88 protein [Periconia macrospinosa]